MMTYDSQAEDHITIFPRPSPLYFGYCKQSKTGGIEGLRMRPQLPPRFSKIIIIDMFSTIQEFAQS